MKFYHLLLITAAGVLLSSPAFGQEGEEADKVVKLTLHPMPEPTPALKYKLLPPFLERRPGNAAVWWNRIPAEETRYFNEMWKEGGTWEKIEKWMELPLGDPREKEFRVKNPAIVNSLNDSAIFRDMAHAARFESCDWQLPIREGNVVLMRIPEVYQLQQYGRLLAAKARLETAEGQYARAVETMQADFALARHAACGQTMVHELVGVAIAAQISGQIEQFIQQPEAPNLYWALSTLPQPLIDFRPAFEEESNFVVLQFPELKDLDKKELSPEDWRKLLEKMICNFQGIIGAAGVAGDNPNRYQFTQLGMYVMAVQAYPLAKEYLIEQGRSAAEVEKMAVAQVLLVASVEHYQQIADEYFKAFALPYAEGEKFSRQAEARLKEIAAERREIIPYASFFLPAIGQVKMSEARLQWILARLRILEALRIYAAAHDGRLPERLDEITDVPIPRNPFDEKPFTYHRDGNRAVLSCEHGPPNVPLRYEITMLPRGEK